MAQGTRLRQTLFLAAHEIGFPGFHRLWREVRAAEREDYAVLMERQTARLQTMVEFAIAKVPYYRDRARGLGVSSRDIKTVEDLQCLPILARSVVRERYHDLCPEGLGGERYDTRSTGGTTGMPLEYRVARSDRFLGAAIMYRGWGYAGYRPGDSMVALGGRSLGIRGRPSVASRLQGTARNLTRLSAFDMNESALDSYISCINRVKPAFLRGYPGAIRVLAQRVLEKKTAIWRPRAILTTSENLLPPMRSSIEEAFGCPVFDGYGLNDGGVSAYECEVHEGLHIDTERAILEVVDDEGRPLRKGIGRIIATTLTNYAMPLLRYETGDIGEIDGRAVCDCGRAQPLLKRVLGRSTDVLVTPEGTQVHGWFFLYMFWDLGKGIREYLVSQETVRDISIQLVVGPDFERSTVERILQVVREQSPGWAVRVQIVDSLPRTEGGKVKFIENRVPRQS